MPSGPGNSEWLIGLLWLALLNLAQYYYHGPLRKDFPGMRMCSAPSTWCGGRYWAVGRTSPADSSADDNATQRLN